MQRSKLYFKQYSNYVGKNSLGKEFLRQADAVSYSNKVFRILKYQSKYKSPIFLVVPSIFNSPEILFIGNKSSFIQKLQELGSVYLIEWLEITDPDHSLNDYVMELAKALTILNQLTDKKLNLVGHCIGGNLSLAAATIKSELITSLTMLTMPWDFSHFITHYRIHQYLDLDKNIKQLEVVPKIYIQILFFLLSPEYFNKKLDRYFKLTLDQDKAFFFKIENWLMSGYSLPVATYSQITKKLIDLNETANGLWFIENRKIDPSNINIPTCIVFAQKDKIAPKQSILTLHQQLKHSTILEVEGGHISYLLDNQLCQFFLKYKLWFEAIK